MNSAILRLLIAGDNLVHQKVAVQLLKRIGFTNVMVVHNGRVAVETVMAPVGRSDGECAEGRSGDVPRGGNE